MKRFLPKAAVACFLLSSSFTNVASSELVVFPGAQGHGVDTPAGRGGQVIRVTNLDDSGYGSLRAALEASGPRIVIFEVSGYIDLESAIVISEPFLTVAGQTAPAPGVVVRDYFVQIATHDVLLQHLIFRIGDRRPFPVDNPAGDGMQIGLWQEPDSVYNVVVDHCSVSWALDEGLDIMRGVHDVTISNSMICQGLRASVHSQGPLGTGPLVGSSVTNITLHRNLLAHNGDRNPKFGSGTTGVFVNNIVYSVKNNPDISPIDSLALDPIALSFESNLFVTHENPNVYNKHALLVLYGPGYNWREGSQVWIDNNDCFECADSWSADVHVEGSGSVPQAVANLEAGERQAWPETGLSVLAATSLADSVLPWVGAFPESRLSIEEGFVQDFSGEAGGRVDCVDDEPITLDSGEVVSATSSTLTLDESLAQYSSCFLGYQIRVTDGVDTQVRTVTEFDPVAGTMVVAAAWSPVPDESYTWEVFQSCEENAGGWGSVPELYRALTTPTDPHGDEDSDGYTNVEEWIHSFPRDTTQLVDVVAYTDSATTPGRHFSYQHRAKVSWTTTDVASAQVRYRKVGEGAWSYVNGEAVHSTSHRVVVPDLDAGSVYEFQPISIAGGLASYGEVDTAATDSATVELSGFSIAQAKVGNSVRLTIGYTTSQHASCGIDLRLEASPPIPWSSIEFSDSTLHSGPHSHVIQGLLPNTYYHAYIFMNAGAGHTGEDTFFPDGAVPDSTSTVYVRILTLNKQGGGGGYDFEEVSRGIEPLVTFLGPGYPNPFNPTVRMEYGVAGARTDVAIQVFDVRGRLVRTLVDDVIAAGRYTLSWDGRTDAGAPVAAGVYFTRMVVGSNTFVRKSVLLK